MTDEQAPTGAPGARNRRRTRTIELGATADAPVSEHASVAADAPPPSPGQVHGDSSGPEPAATDDWRGATTAAGMEAASAATSADAGAAPRSEGPQASPRRRAAWPMIAAGAAGGAAAAIALGIAALLLDRELRPRAHEARLASIEQQLRELGGRTPPAGEAGKVEDLSRRIASLEAAVVPLRAAASDPALVNRVSGVEGGVRALGETVSILGRRSDETAVTAREARQRADTAAATLNDLTQRLARPGAPAIERSELETLAGRVAAVERAERSVEAQLAKPASSEDRTVRLAVAAAALAAAVERGAPFAAELRAVKALAPSEPGSLAALDAFAATGVPTAASLARELSALVPALAAAAGAPARPGGLLDKLQAGAERLVRIRPLDEVGGSDAAAMVARIESRAARADVPGALAELAQLPSDVRSPAAPWIARAQARAAAVEASRRLAADALSVLGK